MCELILSVYRFQIRHNESIPFHEPKAFDAEHERRRKEQLNRLFSRTPEQVSSRVC